MLRPFLTARSVKYNAVIKVFEWHAKATERLTFLQKT